MADAAGRRNRVFLIIRHKLRGVIWHFIVRHLLHVPSFLLSLFIVVRVTRVTVPKNGTSGALPFILAARRSGKSKTSRKNKHPTENSALRAPLGGPGSFRFRSGQRVTQQTAPVSGRENNPARLKLRFRGNAQQLPGITCEASAPSLR